MVGVEAALEIRVLHRHGKSIREIARETGVVPRPAGRGDEKRLLPAPRRQARWLPNEPAGRVPRRASPLPADELSPRIYSRPVSPKDGGLFAALGPPPLPQAATDVSAAVLARGRSLVSEGDQAHGVPACSGCHGPKLTGTEPAIPGLMGLHASYISAQLGAFRYGTRTAAAPIRAVR
jgi:cytochrome c553